jgi:hypothetical protein
VTTTETETHTAAIPTTPVVAGPTTTATRACPLISLPAVMVIVGQRLDHSTVRTSGGQAVGCDFYPITTGPLATKENLPKEGYPSAQIEVATYPSAESARQVLAIVSRAGGSPSLQSVGGQAAETYQTRFYPPDGRSDWACAFIKSSKLVTVLVAEATSDGQTNVLTLAERLYAHV